jgi:hypothetical protein
VGIGSNTLNVRSYSQVSGTNTQRGSSWTRYSNFAYLRMTRDGSNNLSWDWSADGILWLLIATVASATFSLTVAKRGISIGQGTATCHYALDWFGSDV